MSCEVCLKHQNLAGLLVIFQNDLLFIAHFPFIGSPHYGHLIIELKRHVTSPREMSESEASAVGLWIQRLSLFLETELSAEHVYLFRIGDVTAHLHFHAVPRFKDTPRDMWGIYLYENPLGRKASEVEIVSISEKARRFFARMA
jgi:diadenosine tetraphosphate (Ap4A) HIT family hydrolase